MIVPVQETYLFRAACSELRTEIQNNRKTQIEKMRSERGQLQHEVDILSQKLNQETLSLKDDLKGMFDDRKMAVNMERRGMDNKVRILCESKRTANLFVRSKSLTTRSPSPSTLTPGAKSRVSAGF